MDRTPLDMAYSKRETTISSAIATLKEHPKGIELLKSLNLLPPSS